MRAVGFLSGILALIFCLSVPPASAADDHGRIAPFSWQDDKSFFWDLSVTVRSGRDSQVTSGSVFYQLRAVKEVSPEDLAGEVAEGSGTGFVISSEGYLLTCHHVVEDATEIEVILGEDRYRGEVVGSDAERDLAIVRIDARGLPALSLAYDKGIAIGMELRAFGYPLSPVLGESVKVTRGSLAGIVEQEGKRHYQIDASINPGNSGGPVVNARGEVVGVASMKLMGSGISTVDFAVPGGDAQPLLCKHGVGFSMGGEQETLDGPSLVRRVQPSVALLKVKSQKRRSNGQKRYTLSVILRRLDTQRFRDDYLPIDLLPKGSHDNTPATLVVDDFGNVIETVGDISNPIGLDFTGPVGTEPIPDPCPHAWSTENERVLCFAKASRRGDGNASGMPSLPFQRDSLVVEVVMVPAREKCQYEVVSAGAAQLVLKKQYELKVAPSDDSPALTVTGTGTVTIDREMGITKSCEFKGEVSLPTAGATKKVPIKVEGRTNVLDRKKPSSRSRRSAAGSSATGSPPNYVNPYSDLDQVLANLRSSKTPPYMVNSLLLHLVLMKPVENRREEAAAVIESFLRSREVRVCEQAARALGVWGTERNISALKPLLNHSDSRLREAGLEAIGKIGGAAAAEAIVGSVTNGLQAGSVEKVLKEIGGDAEPAVSTMLAHNDPSVRYIACRIMREIGGPGSLQELRKMAESDPDSSCRRVAASAVEEIQKRNP